MPTEGFRGILTLLAEEMQTKAEVVWIRSGKNHKWRKDRVILAREDIEGEEKSRAQASDIFKEEMRMRWWNEYTPPSTPTVLWNTTDQVHWERHLDRNYWDGEN